MKNKYLIQLRQILSREYAVIYNMRIKDQISDIDIETYIEHYPSIHSVLEQQRLASELQRKQESYRLIVERTETRAKEYLKTLKNERTVLTEELRQETLKQSITPKSIVQSNNKRKVLEDKLLEIDKVISALSDAISNVKRQRGRPRKTEEVDYEEEPKD